MTQTTNEIPTPVPSRAARWLDAKEMTLTRTDGGFLDLTYDGTHYPRIAVHRCFPFSAPDEYLSFRDSTDDATEIGMLRALADLPKTDQDLVREQLTLRYFTPIITKVHKIKEEYGYSYWDVTTDRGEARFVVRMGSGTVNRIGGTRYIVNDIDGNRFEIPDLLALTTAEQKKLDMFV